VKFANPGDIRSMARAESSISRKLAGSRKRIKSSLKSANAHLRYTPHTFSEYKENLKKTAVGPGGWAISKQSPEYKLALEKKERMKQAADRYRKKNLAANERNEHKQETDPATAQKRQLLRALGAQGGQLDPLPDPKPEPGVAAPPAAASKSPSPTRSRTKRSSSNTTPSPSKPAKPSASPSAHSLKSPSNSSNSKRSPAGPQSSYFLLANPAYPSGKDARAEEFDEVEQDVKDWLKDKVSLDAFWKRLRKNTYGEAKLQEVYRRVEEKFPSLSYRGAAVCAFNRSYVAKVPQDADLTEVRMPPNEFKGFMLTLACYNRIFAVMAADAGSNATTQEERQIGLDEFQTLPKRLGLHIAPDEVRVQYDLLAHAHGNVVTFHTMCNWFLKKKKLPKKLQQPPSLNMHGNTTKPQMPVKVAKLPDKGVAASTIPLIKKTDYKVSKRGLRKFFRPEYPAQEWDHVETDVEAWVNNRDLMKELWNSVSVNKIAKLSDIWAAMRSRFPMLKDAAAVVKAFKRTTTKAPISLAALQAAGSPSAAAGKSGKSFELEPPGGPGFLAPPSASDPFGAVELELEAAARDVDKLKRIWKALDFNGNGKVSLAEIDKYVVETYPVLNHKPALMRAYKRSTSREGGGDGDAWVEKKELKALLRNVLYYNKLFKVFDEVDTGDDRRIDRAEFAAGLSKLGVGLQQQDIDREFDRVDANGGGQVLFDEFCAWFLAKKGVQDYSSSSPAANSNTRSPSSKSASSPSNKDSKGDSKDNGSGDNNSNSSDKEKKADKPGNAVLSPADEEVMQNGKIRLKALISVMRNVVLFHRLADLDAQLGPALVAESLAFEDFKTYASKLGARFDFHTDKNAEFGRLDIDSNGIISRPLFNEWYLSRKGWVVGGQPDEKIQPLKSKPRKRRPAPADDLAGATKLKGRQWKEFNSLGKLSPAQLSAFEKDYFGLLQSKTQFEEMWSVLGGGESAHAVAARGVRTYVLDNFAPLQDPAAYDFSLQRVRATKPTDPNAKQSKSRKPPPAGKRGKPPGRKGPPPAADAEVDGGGDSGDLVQAWQAKQFMLDLYLFLRWQLTYFDSEIGDVRTPDAFQTVFSKLGVEVSEQAAAEAIGQLQNEQGVVSHDSLYKWYFDSREAELEALLQQKQDEPSSHRSNQGPQLSSHKFDLLEKQIMTMMGNQAQLKAIWRQLDVNGNGKVSLAELDKLVVDRWPLLHHGPALIRAHKRTTSVAGGGDGDDWVQKKELKSMLRNLFFFNRLFDAFEEIDTGDDRRIDMAEFVSGAHYLNMNLSDAQAEKEFKKIDANGGGQILFDELCTWYIKKEEDASPLTKEDMVYESDASEKDIDLTKTQDDEDEDLPVLSRLDRAGEKIKALSNESVSMFWESEFANKAEVPLEQFESFAIKEYAPVSEVALQWMFEKATGTKMVDDGTSTNIVTKDQIIPLLTCAFFQEKCFEASNSPGEDLTKTDFESAAKKLHKTMISTEIDDLYEKLKAPSGKVPYDNLSNWFVDMKTNNKYKK